MKKIKSAPSVLILCTGLLFIFLVLSGCQKELSSLYSDTRPNTSLEEFFEKTTSSSMQSFTLNTNAGGTIRGEKGTDFTFKKLSFIDPDGSLIRGTVKLNVLEILTPADIILNNAATMSNGLPLESGGAFYIDATYNNQKARLAPGTFVKIDILNTSASSPGMQVFSGYRQDTTGSVNWIVNNSPGNMVVPDSARGNRNPLDTINVLFSDSLNWINCDKFLNEPKIACSFPFENNPDKDSTAIFVQFTGRNSVMRIYEDANTGFGSPSLVAGPATVVGICIKDQKLYSSVINVSLQSRQSFTLKFSADTQEQLKDKLKLLK